MTNLTKIKDVSAQYDITARTLHYYEKMGLISSIRDDSSGHRLYDEAALTRLKQVLILRKMNISIRDIVQIFNANDSDAVLSVLERKADDIDNEVAILHELKEIVLEFIDQIKQADFGNENHVKLLYDKAKEIETTLTSSNKIGELLDTSDIVDDNLASIEVKIEDKQKYPGVITNFEVKKHDAMRFIGCSVYCRFNWGHAQHPITDILGSVWSAKEWVFSTLDAMTEHQTDMPYAAALYIMDRYEDTPGREAQGYIIGKFMKADTPVPSGMDWIEIPAGTTAMGWGGYVENETYDATRDAGYDPATWFWHGEIFEDFNSFKGQPGPNSVAGYMVHCYPMSEEKRKTAQAKAKIKNLLKENPDKGLAELKEAYADDAETLSAIQAVYDDIIRQSNEEVRQSSYPPSVSQFEVYNTSKTEVSAVREGENLARKEGANPIAINSVASRYANLTSGNFDANDDGNRWSSDMTDGLLDDAEVDWINTKNTWFGADLGAVTTINSVIVTETAAIGFGADIRRTIGDWIVEVASEINNPNENRTLSADGWTVVASGSGVGQGRVSFVSFSATQARYVRMRTVSTKMG